MIKSGNSYFHSKVFVKTRTFFSVIIRGTFISFAMQNPRILFFMFSRVSDEIRQTRGSVS